MIILEGPDGGGKTTLAAHLLSKFEIALAPRFATSTGGPKNEMARLITEDLAQWPHLKIYDRHTLISDPIYSLAMKRPIQECLTNRSWFHTRYRELMAHDPLVIVCLPPIEVGRANMLKDEAEGNNLSGVAEAYDEIWKGYYNWSCQFAGDLIWWDYSHTMPAARIDIIADRVARKLHPSERTEA